MRRYVDELRALEAGKLPRRPRAQTPAVDEETTHGGLVTGGEARGGGGDDFRSRSGWKLVSWEGIGGYGGPTRSESIAGATAGGKGQPQAFGRAASKQLPSPTIAFKIPKMVAAAAAARSTPAPVQGGVNIDLSADVLGPTFKSRRTFSGDGFQEIEANNIGDKDTGGEVGTAGGWGNAVAAKDEPGYNHNYDGGDRHGSGGKSKGGMYDRAGDGRGWGSGDIVKRKREEPPLPPPPSSGHRHDLDHERRGGFPDRDRDRARDRRRFSPGCRPCIGVSLVVGDSAFGGGGGGQGSSGGGGGDWRLSSCESSDPAYLPQELQGDPNTQMTFEMSVTVRPLSCSPATCAHDPSCTSSTS